MQNQFNEFLKRIKSDAFLKEKLDAVQGANDLVRLARSMEFDIDEADLESALLFDDNIAEDELLNVAAGSLADLSTGFATCPVRNNKAGISEDELLNVAAGSLADLSTGFATCPVRNGKAAISEDELLCVAGGGFDDLSTGFATCPVRNAA